MIPPPAAPDPEAMAPDQRRRRQVAALLARGVLRVLKLQRRTGGGLPSPDCESGDHGLAVTAESRLHVSRAGGEEPAR